MVFLSSDVHCSFYIDWRSCSIWGQGVHLFRIVSLYRYKYLFIYLQNFLIICRSKLQIILKSRKKIYDTVKWWLKFSLLVY